MPRKKKVEETTLVEEVVVETEPEVVAPVNELPYYDGAQVVRIIEDNRSTKTHLHCKMSDNTTKHVPRELFDK